MLRERLGWIGFLQPELFHLGANSPRRPTEKVGDLLDRLAILDAPDEVARITLAPGQRGVQRPFFRLAHAHKTVP